MKTHRIATELYRSEWVPFAKGVIPPWIDGYAEEEDRIKKVFLNAKEVIRQRDELTAMRPEKKEEYRLQCENVIWDLAAKIQDMVSIDAL